MPSGDFVLFILLGVLWDSWICSLMSVINFGKFSAFFISNIYSASFFSFWYSHYTHLITLYAPLPPGCFFILSFPLCISVWRVTLLLRVFQLAGSLLSCVWSADDPSFVSGAMCMVSSISPCSFLESQLYA